MDTIRRMIKKILVCLFGILGYLTKKVNAITYKLLFYAEWGIIDTPENFDHELDLYWQWDEKCFPYWLERGVYSVQALKMFEDPCVVELCCGDGFNAKHFYSTSAKEIVACDFDKNIIKTAKRKNRRSNISFYEGDIRNGIYSIFGDKMRGGVTNIIWDAAIEHFTPTEINDIMNDIKQVLSCRKGILSGYTIVEARDGKSLEQHEYEFKDMGDLKRFLVPYFKNVYVFETIYPDRHNLYFYASDGPIPFEESWEHGLRTATRA